MMIIKVMMEGAVRLACGCPARGASREGELERGGDHRARHHVEKEGKSQELHAADRMLLEEQAEQGESMQDELGDQGGTEERTFELGRGEKQAQER